MKKKHSIRQRKKGDIIHCDCKIPLQPNIVSLSGDEVAPEGDKINLTISAYPGDWEKLSRFSPDDLGKLLYLNAIYPVCTEKIWDIESQDEFMHHSRIFIAAAFVIISHWIAKPEKEWSNYFRELITKLKEDDIFIKNTKRYNEAKIVFHLWNYRFEERRKTVGIKFPEDIKTFRDTYKYNNPNMDAAKVFFTKLGQNSTIEDLENILT